MEIKNIKINKYFGEGEIFPFFLSNESKRGKIIFEEVNKSKIFLRNEKINGKVHTNEIIGKDGICEVITDMSNYITNQHYHFVGTNYKTEYSKFTNNKFFIMRKQYLDENFKGNNYKLSLFASIEFSEFNQ